MWMEIWTAKTLGIPDRGEFPEQLTVYIINGIIAQWLERTPGKRDVAGSSPADSAMR